MVVVFAPPDDGLAADVHGQLAALGAESMLAPPPEPSSPFKIGWNVSQRNKGCVVLGRRRLGMDEIEGVLARALPALPPGGGIESNEDYLRLEWLAAVLGWLQDLPAVVIDRPRPGRTFRFPALHRLASRFTACHLPLAPVLVTDRLAEARLFFRKHGGRVLVDRGLLDKPAVVEEEGKLPIGVCCLSAFPVGVRRRIHVAGGEAFSEVVDDHGNALPDKLPFDLAERSRAVACHFGLRFMEITAVSGEDGEMVIGAGELPQAVFGDLEHRAQVAGALAAALVKRQETQPS